METVRDLITGAMVRSNYCSPDTPPSHEEAAVFAQSLQLILSDFRAKGILNPSISQKNIPWPSGSAEPNFSTVKFIDTTGSYWRDLSSKEKKKIAKDPHWVLVEGRPLRPSSVSISLTGSGSIFQPGKYISPDALFTLRGTTQGDYRYPVCWSWQAGKFPELLLLCRHLQPQAVLLNALFDQYSNLELDSSLDNWLEGLPMVAAAFLEWKICDTGCVGDPQAKKREAFRLLNSYQDSFHHSA
ncbi:MAG: hypothetical protein LBU89_10930 [Fibromonadaceae bacterium]|jgi:hypothetical protein|nr:hypothetical protein [Fibromonadaceae bacterium]